MNGGAVTAVSGFPRSRHAARHFNQKIAATADFPEVAILIEL